MRPKRKSPGSWQHQLCPSPQEIRDYKYGHLDPARRSVVGRHLRRCRVCAKIYRAPYTLHQDDSVPLERTDLKAVIEKLYRQTPNVPTHEADPLHLGSGQVWTVAPPPPGATLTTGERIYMGTPVVIVDPGNKQRTEGNEIRCMPLSNDTDFHLPTETILIPAVDSPLGFAFLVEVFNERPMLARDLRRYQGAISSGQMRELNHVRQQFWFSGLEEGMPTPPDYKEWKHLEIEMAAYLSAPVNTALWPDAEDDEGKVVWLQPYRLAADKGIELKENHHTNLWQDQRLVASIIQTRNRLRLKVVWRQGGPGRVLVDGRLIAACDGDAEEQYFDLGTVADIPGALNIEIQLADDVIRIPANFQRPAEE